MKELIQLPFDPLPHVTLSLLSAIQLAHGDAEVHIALLPDMVRFSPRRHLAQVPGRGQQIPDLKI